MKQDLSVFHLLATQAGERLRRSPAWLLSAEP